jgi:hypothetical protein
MTSIADMKTAGLGEQFSANAGDRLVFRRATRIMTGAMEEL